MSDDTPTNPMGKVPSARGIVANAGTQPEAAALTAVKELWSRKAVRDALAEGAYWLLGRFFPGAAKSIALQQLEPHLLAIIEAGSK